MSAAHAADGRGTSATPAPFERVHPLRETRRGPRPFPTLYWLRDPALLHAISDLERRGAIAGYAERIAADPVFRATVATDHARYAAERWALLTDADRARCAALGFTAALRDRGVAGAADPAAVKCLHAHAAHALADRAAGRPENAIGAEVLGRLGA